MVLYVEQIVNFMQPDTQIINIQNKVQNCQQWN